jgi:aspartyl-tRNA(Asn)/glutamyl-tRNA(Gln) amidotransferase subunit B
MALVLAPREFGTTTLRRRDGGDADGWLKQLGISGVLDDAALGALIDGVLASNGPKVAEYRGGKTSLIGFFLGQVVRASKGQADPKLVQPLLEARLKPAV